MAWLLRHFATIDARTLGLGRIAVALTLLFDLSKRSLVLDAFYTDDGLLPRALVRGLDPLGWSLLWGVSDPALVRVVFVGCAVVYLMLLVGWVTKVAQVLSLCALLSLQHRVTFLTGGGDIVLCLLLWWTLPLPLGRRFSVDAVRRGESVDGARDVVSVAVLGLTLQLAVIYLFNAIQKSGATWMGGSAMHYTLWLDGYATPLAEWCRGILSPTGSKVLTWGTLAVEGALPVLILMPLGRPWTRRIAMLLIVGLHAGIASMVNVGMFSASMIAFSTFLVAREDWDLVGRWASRLGTRLTGGLGRFAARFRHVRDAAHRRWDRARRILGEGFAAVLLGMCAVQVLNMNDAIPGALRVPVPAWFVDLAGAMRIGERWSMFAPDVSQVDTALIVDAETVTGRHVDPLNALSSRVADPLLREVPPQLGANTYVAEYMRRVPQAPRLHTALSAWVLRQGAETEEPGDDVVRSTVYRVARTSPIPGHDEPLAPTSTVLVEGER